MNACLLITKPQLLYGEKSLGDPFTISWAVLVTCQRCALDVLPMFKIFLLVSFHLACEQTHANI